MLPILFGLRKLESHLPGLRLDLPGLTILREPELPQSCYWILKLDLSSPRVAFKGLYKILQFLLCDSILYKNSDSDTTEAYIFTHFHLKGGQITLAASGMTSQQKLAFVGRGGGS